MIKGTAEDWLELIKECLKQKSYGDADFCAYCNFIRQEWLERCNLCLIYEIGYQSICFFVSESTEYLIKGLLTELKIALESLIKGYGGK